MIRFHRAAVTRGGPLGQLDNWQAGRQAGRQARRANESIPFYFVLPWKDLFQEF